ncbi:DNA-binding death effector domain-containing protein 2 isoform X3 [Ochotona curzoniae]|uniref:DNA-binding death effector domain-containing protein 2 isoform X3 n=1 Tax=Ochotona curzoniae TaxID=130825 RepID=UPI001B34A58D|nr:DNA-binding death effector domain-containing protein 2 isoform X3 [Ochotona curzoniae]
MGHPPLPWVGPASALISHPSSGGMALSGLTPAPSWEEDECLDYYGMLSLHRMFEVVGGQLTECELELLAFLLDEAPGAAGGLARARSGLELLLELERRGQCDESNLRLLGQLLRVLARHDLLPHLARKRRRPVSPERYSYGTSSSSSKRTEGSCRRRRPSSSSSDSQQGQWETGSPPTKRQRRSRGRPSGGARRRRRGIPAAPQQQQQQQQQPARPSSEGKVTCDGETEAQRGEVTCLRPPRLERGRAGTHLQTFGSGFEQSTASMGRPWSRVWRPGGPRPWQGSWMCLGKPLQCCAHGTWAPWCVTSSSQSSPTWTPSGVTT